MAYIYASTRTILFLSRSTTKLSLFPFKPSFSSSSSSSSPSSYPSFTLHFTRTKCTLQHQPQTLLRRNVIEVLEERGLLDSTTNDSALRSSAAPSPSSSSGAANSPPLKVYCGFDPTAESLHLGNLLGIIVLSWFHRCGHQPLALIGGATARVGDPSGKSLERPELDVATLERNTAGISQTIKQILGGSLNSNLEGSKVVILNNYDWWKEFSLLEFLKNVGKYARVGSMIAKESVRKRLESEQGMSYTELTYQLLQGYDFLYLFQNEGVNVQIGGSDQWGNITVGTELIRKILQVEGAYGLTFPLLLKSDGTKFGKSEDGAIWLSPAMLSPYKFYQYFFTVPDADVIRFLKILTFLDIEEIVALEGEMKKPGYVPNTAQRRLAEEVTRFVHGEEGLTEALKATEALRPGSETKLDWKTIEGIAEGVPTCSLAYDSVLNLSLVDLSVSSGLFESKSAARRLLKQGGLYLNNNRVDSENKRIEEADIVDGKVLLLSAGKKNKLDRLPKSSTVTEVDPEIRFDLIDVSEVRLKLSLETAPGQRPHGVLVIWSPILSAVGNAFKIQVHLRKVMHRDRFMRKSSIVPAIGNRVWRDLIHNPLHLIFSVDVLGMTSSTLASLSRGFAELSTDGQFLQLREKQVRSRRITGVGDGILQGTEALAQGVAFGVSGVVRKPVESARQNGLIGLAHGLGRAFLGFIVQPVSGALDFFSMTVDGIVASCSKCLKVFNNKTTFHRIRNPRAIRANGVLTEYCEKEATGQMVLYLGEASRHFGCTEIFKEPSKFALSDYYEEHFIVPHQRIVLVTNKRVILLQMDKRPCKIMFDVPWDELMALELAKAGSTQPSHLILHPRHFRRSEKFARVIKCNSVDEFEGIEPQAVKICSVVHRTWKAYQADMKSLVLKVPSSQRHVHFAWSEVDNREPRTSNKGIISSRDISSHNATSDDRRFVKHSITFTKIWSSEQEYKTRCSLCRKQVSEDGGICSIWRPVCPDGYTYIGDIARGGIHPPNVAAIYRKVDGHFALPMGYDLVWRNCSEDYVSPVSIWHPRAPDGFVSPGCVAVAAHMEPEPDLVYCVAESLVEETKFEEQKVWSAPESYPWGCHIYQAESDALHFVALRQIKEESNWKPMRVRDDPHCPLQSS